MRCLEACAIHNLLGDTLDRYKLIEFVTSVVFSYMVCQGCDVG